MKKVFAVILLITVMSCNNQKTGYVDNTRLIQEYSKMKKIEAEFTSRSEIMRLELDSAAREFEAEVKAFEVDRATMSENEQEAAYRDFMERQQALQQEAQMRSNQLRRESDQVIDSLVTEVRNFVAKYGEENGYTYIFGSNETANILYAEEGLEITDEVLRELNAAGE